MNREEEQKLDADLADIPEADRAKVKEAIRRAIEVQARITPRERFAQLLDSDMGEMLSRTFAQATGQPIEATSLPKIGVTIRQMLSKKALSMTDLEAMYVAGFGDGQSALAEAFRVATDVMCDNGAKTVDVPTQSTIPN